MTVSVQQGIPNANGILTPIEGTEQEIVVTEAGGADLFISGNIQVLTDTMDGNGAASGSYNLILERSTNAQFSGLVDQLTFTSGLAFLELGNQTVAFQGSASVSYIDRITEPGVYYYRLTFRPQSVRINAGEYVVQERSLNILQFDRTIP